MAGERDPWAFRLFWMGLVMALLAIGLLEVWTRQFEELQGEIRLAVEAYEENRAVITKVANFKTERERYEQKVETISAISQHIRDAEAGSTP